MKTIEKMIGWFFIGVMIFSCVVCAVDVVCFLIKNK